jgi:hypothetical protein
MSTPGRHGRHALIAGREHARIRERRVSYGVLRARPPSASAPPETFIALLINCLISAMPLRRGKAGLSKVLSAARETQGLAWSRRGCKVRLTRFVYVQYNTLVVGLRGVDAARSGNIQRFGLVSAVAAYIPNHTVVIVYGVGTRRPCPEPG